MDYWHFRDSAKREKLQQNMDTEILVIGGGIAGIMAAHFLTKKAFKVVLVEQNQIGCGVTKGTTAVLSLLEDTSYATLIDTIGLNRTLSYYNALLESFDYYKNLSKKVNFLYEEIEVTKYLTDRTLYLAECRALDNLDVEYKKEEIDGTYYIKTKGAMFNPKLLINYLSKDLSIYEDSKVMNISGNEALVNNYIIKANHIVIATNYPILKLRGMFYLKLSQNVSYIKIKNGSNEKKANLGGKPGSVYLREEERIILEGFDDRRVGKNQTLIPKEYSWSNQDTVTLDSLPYIGKIKNKPYYVITGFNLFGMSKAYIGAKVITKTICNENINENELFSIYRPIPKKSLFRHLRIVVPSFFKIKKRCRHLGCALNFNEITKEYECPCHGSRYSEDGKIIYGPTQKELK